MDRAQKRRRLQNIAILWIVVLCVDLTASLRGEAI
jgi:hypothetical protein